VNTHPRLQKHATTLRARSLRAEATVAENKLWQVLRDRQVDGAKFRRQAPINRYFADFCCEGHKLIVEVDGAQHAEQESYDAARSAQLKARGNRVLRFWNEDVLKNLEGVMDTIRAELQRRG
jgi:very-short-patch-repair endonuclease